MLKRDYKSLSATYAKLRAVEADAHTDGISKYIRYNDRAIKETIPLQIRQRQRWDHDKHALRERLTADPELVRDWQLERIRLLVDCAYRVSPFYRELYDAAGFEPGDIVSWADFQALPIVNKKMFEDAGVDQ